MIKLPELKNQPVRDLAWSCFSEPLISDFTAIAGEDAPLHCALQLTDKRLEWLLQLDNHPQLLLGFLDRVKPRRLGLYHEALWHFFLQQDDEVELISQNMQVTESGRTIGEFDVIYRDLVRDRYVHLELAFKFYLQSPGQSPSYLAQWLGPNVNDRLDLKLEHMLSHQCQLSKTNAGRQHIESLGIGRVERQLSLRGYLLFPLTQQDNSVLPIPLNSGLLRGQWLPVSELMSRLSQYEAWIIVPRLHWISPGIPESATVYNPADFADYLLQHFKQNQASIMISALTRGDSNQFSEKLRLIVTANNWPARQQS